MIEHSTSVRTDDCAYIAVEPLHELLPRAEPKLVEAYQRLSLIAFRQQRADGAEHLVFVHNASSSVGSSAVRAREVRDLFPVLEGHATLEPETERFERLERGQGCTSGDRQLEMMAFAPMPRPPWCTRSCWKPSMDHISDTAVEGARPVTTAMYSIVLWGTSL